LITGILLQCKDLIDTNQQNTWFTIKRFYIRRFIRIIPVYYLTIFATVILAFSLIKLSLIWHLTYTSNIYFSLKDWDELTAHFWSLALEEQFYLIWPWFIILTPKKHLLKLILITTLTGQLFRLLMIVLNLDNGTREYILTFACLDSLGMGAILAFYTHHQPQLELEKNIYVTLVFGLVCLYL
jgi:peptidoglycan/LPS O-acetylase OafA/YrhL